MGFKDDEVIEHNMISTSIERAQKRIDENLSIHNNNTRQRKDWFDLNLPAIEKF
jgi:preprotein translocase subunit SecA